MDFAMPRNNLQTDPKTRMKEKKVKEAYIVKGMHRLPAVIPVLRD